MTTSLPPHPSTGLPASETLGGAAAGERLPQAAPAHHAASAGAKGNQPLTSWRQKTQQALATRSPRERQALWVAALFVGAALLYAVAIRPAWTTVRNAPVQLAALDAQLQGMQAMAGDSRELRGAPRLPPAQAGAALKSSTDALGSVARLSVVGDRATVTFTNATGDQVRRWLVDARASARAKPVEATLTRGSSGLSGTVLVALPTP